MMFTEVLLSTVLLNCISANLQGDFVRVDERYSDVLPVSDILWTKSGSLICCGAKCYNDVNCESFFYNSGKRHGYIRRLHDNISTKLTLGMKYYEMAGPVGNLAAGKPASQSSMYPYGNFEASLAVDGSRDPFMHPVTPYSCSCTDFSDYTPFFQVDLLSQHKITTVAFLSRSNCCGKRNAGLNITVAATTAGPYMLCYYYPPGEGFKNEMKTFFCTQP